MTESLLPDRQRGYALRFISGKYQGGEFQLPPGGEIVIGRSSELDMVLVEDMVSRRHAKIEVLGGSEIYLEDLGSTNGSFVNGERIQRTRLSEGDRILIGTSIIKLVASEQSGSYDAGEIKPLQSLGPAKRSSQVRTMTGSIGEVPLPDLLQLFAASKKTGVLVVRTERDEGKIFLEQGRPVYATINQNSEIRPLKCMFRILAWEEGTFDMESAESIPQFDDAIDLSTEAILMEGMRQLDELRRLGPDIPPMQTHLSLVVPLVAPLRELAPEELDILQLAHNYGHVETIHNKSAASDLETAERLVGLIQKKYLRIG